MEIAYNNLFEAYRERKATEAEAKLLQAQTMAELVDLPIQKISPLLYLIPVAGILVIGAVILMSKKRK